MKEFRLIAIVLAICTVGLIAQDLSDPKGAFSHKTHAPLKMKCVQCHKAAENGHIATFPAVADCKVCHTAMAERTIPEKRVYRVRDFVIFSHKYHSFAGVECATCHGDVTAKHVLEVERPLTMASCVACHKEKRATISCNACHELGQ